LTLILSEALLLGLMGGLLGILIARGIIALLVNVPFLGDVLRAFPNLGLSPGVAALGVGIALLLGLLAGFIPAMLAYRARITTALRQV
jgi:ABC-type antimicrobial peptide transport system permease subunit